MSNHPKKLLVLAFALGSFTAAYAGMKSSQLVVITSTSATGAVGSVRSSADTYQHIGCQLYNVGTTPYVYCSAQNYNTTLQLNCIQNANPAIVSAVSAIGPASYIHFAVDGTNCSLVNVYNSSRWAPMQP